MSLDLEQLAARQLADYDARTPGGIFAEPLSLTAASAYGIQERVAALREERGERVIGYKVGCTSPVIQEQLGIRHPILGRLFDSERHISGVELSASRFRNLAIEGELAVRLSADFPGGSWPAGGLDEFVESIFPVIELHNHFHRRPVPTPEELIASNALHAGFVLPEHPVPLPIALPTAGEPELTSHRTGRMTIRIDGTGVATAGAGELMEGLEQSLRWLGEVLRDRGLSLRPGQFILGGTRTGLIPVRAPSHIVVDAPPLGTVEARVEP